MIKNACTEMPSKVRDYLLSKMANGVDFIAFCSRNGYMIKADMNDFFNALVAMPEMMETHNGTHLIKFHYFDLHDRHSIAERRRNKVTPAGERVFDFLDLMPSAEVFRIDEQYLRKTSKDLCPNWQNAESFLAKVFNGTLTSKVTNHIADVSYIDRNGVTHLVEVKALHGWLDGADHE